MVKNYSNTKGKYLRKLGDLLAEKSEELGKIESIDTGKLLKETRGKQNTLQNTSTITLDLQTKLKAQHFQSISQICMHLM